MPHKYKTGKPLVTGHQAALADTPFIFNNNEITGSDFSIPSDCAISPKDVAEYSEDILAQIRDLATSAGLTFLAYLIQVAVEEARIQAAAHCEHPL